MAAVLAAATLLAASPTAARPLQLEDLLQRESFGAVSLAPGERWLLVEQRRPFAAGSRFDFDRFNGLFRTQLMVADVTRGQPLHPLFQAEAGVGYQAGPISPDGARVVVYRLTPERWELGVASLASGEVRWLGVTPEVPGETRTLQWVSPTRLVAIAMSPGALPFALRAARPQAASPALWAASARGEAAVTVVGSGRWIDARPHAPPKRLVQIAADTGAVETLALGDFVDLELSASERRLAVVEAAEDIPLAADRTVQGPYGIAVRRMRLRLLDLQTRILRAPCPACDVLTSLLSWSPRRDELLAYVRTDGVPWTAGRLIRVAGASGQVSPVDPAVKAAIARRPERVSAGWWGSDPLLFGRRAGDERDDWFRLDPTGPVRLTGGLKHPPTDALVVARDALILAADSAAWRVDRRGHARRLSALPFAVLPRRTEGIPDRTTYALRAGGRLPGVLGSGADARAVRLDARGRSDIAAPAGAGVVAALGSFGAAVDETPGGGAETLLWRHPGAADTVLARINRRLADVDRPAPIPIEHLGPNGEALRSWLFLPQRAAGAPPPPVVVVPYPGTTYRQPPDHIWDDVPMAAAAPLLTHGYAVLLPSLPTPRTGDGPGDGLADRVLAIVDAAARRPDLAGQFDPTRLALWGHSFGGFAVTAMIAQTDRFRAAVAVAAPTDLVSFYGQFEPSRRAYPDEGLSTPWTAGWTESLQGGMRAPPWEAPERYLRNSPIFQAGRIRTPLLLAYGDQDGSHPGQAEELFSALFRQGKDAQLLTYWGEGHVFGSPDNLRDLYARGFAFLDRVFRRPSESAEAEARPTRPEPASANTAPRTPPPPPP